MKEILDMRIFKIIYKIMVFGIPLKEIIEVRIIEIIAIMKIKNLIDCAVFFKEWFNSKFKLKNSLNLNKSS